jgi:hypothetical protein
LAGLGQIFQGKEMGTGQIGYMDAVPNGPYVIVYRIIQGDGQITKRCNSLTGVTADIPGASSNQNVFCHLKTFLYSRQSDSMCNEKLPFFWLTV